MGCSIWWWNGTEEFNFVDVLTVDVKEEGWESDGTCVVDIVVVTALKSHMLFYTE